jgi:hypothetical protein
MRRRSGADEHRAGEHTGASQTNRQGMRTSHRVQRRHFSTVMLDNGDASAIRASSLRLHRVVGKPLPAG